jgi:hypothetical protein
MNKSALLLVRRQTEAETIAWSGEQSFKFLPVHAAIIAHRLLSPARVGSPNRGRSNG